MADTIAAKPWYKSKIVLLSLSSLLVVGSNLLGNWLTGQGVTQEQMDAIAAVQPATADAIHKVQDGSNWLQALVGISSVLVLVFRTWFTSTKIGG